MVSATGKAYRKEDEMKRMLLLAVALLVATPAHATTPEQDAQAARRRMAEVCQNLVMSGLLETCTVADLLPHTKG